MSTIKRESSLSFSHISQRLISSILLTRTQAYETFFDQLNRILLELPSQPALLILGMWSPLVAAGQGYGGPGVVHLPIGHYYDVPYVS